MWVQGSAESARSPSRRAVLGTGAAGLGAAALLLLGADEAEGASRAARRRRRRRAQQQGVQKGVEGTAAAAFPGIPGATNNEIVLNFALTLEILEADLYRQALNKATGRALSAPLASNPNVYQLAVPSGLRCDDETVAGFLYLKQFAYVEAAHRDFLTAAISASGGTPTTANPTGYAFPGGLGNDLKSILTAILPLEETGVRAYLGAAPFLTDLGLIQTATGIYSTECRHSAAVALVLNVDPNPRTMMGDIEVVPNPPSPQTFEKYLQPATVISAAGGYFA